MMTSIPKHGFSDPRGAVQRAVICLASVAVSSFIAKIFIPSINVKSHFTFGAIAGGMGILLFENDHPRELIKKVDASKQKVALVAAFMIQVGVPLLSARMITSWVFKRVSYANMVARASYMGGIGGFSAYVYVSHQRA